MKRAKGLRFLLFGGFTLLIVVPLFSGVEPTRVLGKLHWFPIQHLIFPRSPHVGMEHVEATCGKLQGKDLFEVSLRSLKDCIATMGWVKEIAVSRKLPSSLVIQIEEEAPVAIGWKEEQWVYFSSAGKTIAPVGATEFLRYPLLPQFDKYSAEQQTQALRLAATVSTWAAPAGTTVSDVTWETQRGWIVTLSRGASVLLGDPVSSENMERFQVLLQRFEKSFTANATIDLRIEKKIIVKGFKGT